MLNDVLDKIESSEVTLGQAAQGMSEGERREAAIIHLSALIGAKPNAIRRNEVVVDGLAFVISPSQSASSPLWYADLGAGFSVEGGNLVNKDGPETMEQFLAICQYARDRSDILLYLPKPERTDRVKALVARTGASERFVRFVLSQFRSIYNEIAA